MNHPYNLSKAEVIRQIKEIYHAEPDLENVVFDVYEQLLACEAVAESEKELELHQQNNNQPDENVSVNGNGNGGYKLRVNSTSTLSKQNAIKQLMTCTYQTPPIAISRLLDILFEGYNAEPGWWLYVAQAWTPRAINRVIAQMIKQHKRGAITIQNPAKYFSHAIQFRAKRKITSTIGGSKRNDK